MEHFDKCNFSCKVINADFLNFAPCPPPWLSYSDFRNHSLGQSLSMLEVCIIAERCELIDRDAESDCFLTTTSTSTSDLLSSTSTIISDSYSSTSTIISDSYTPILTPENTCSTNGVIHGVLWSIMAIVLIIL